MTFTITASSIFSWPIGLLLMILSIVALFGGSLPDNSSSPGGDLLRKIIWPLFAMWIIGAIIRGIM